MLAFADRPQESGRRTPPRKPPGGSSSISLAWNEDPPTPVRNCSRLKQAPADAQPKNVNEAERHRLVETGEDGVTRFIYPSCDDRRSACASEPSSVDAFGHHVNRSSSNTYAQGHQQNCGNVLTDRRTARVAAPPGGASSVCLGSGDTPRQGNSGKATPKSLECESIDQSRPVPHGSRGVAPRFIRHTPRKMETCGDSTPRRLQPPESDAGESSTTCHQDVMPNRSRTPPPTFPRMHATKCQDSGDATPRLSSLVESEASDVTPRSRHLAAGVQRARTPPPALPRTQTTKCEDSGDVIPRRPSLLESEASEISGSYHRDLTPRRCILKSEASEISRSATPRSSFDASAQRSRTPPRTPPRTSCMNLHEHLREHLRRAHDASVVDVEARLASGHYENRRERSSLVESECTSTPPVNDRKLDRSQKLQPGGSNPRSAMMQMHSNTSDATTAASSVDRCHNVSHGRCSKTDSEAVSRTDASSSLIPSSALDGAAGKACLFVPRVLNNLKSQAQRRESLASGGSVAYGSQLHDEDFGFGNFSYHGPTQQPHRSVSAPRLHVKAEVEGSKPRKWYPAKAPKAPPGGAQSVLDGKDAKIECRKHFGRVGVGCNRDANAIEALRYFQEEERLGKNAGMPQKPKPTQNARDTHRYYLASEGNSDFIPGRRASKSSECDSLPLGAEWSTCRSESFLHAV